MKVSLNEEIISLKQTQNFFHYELNDYLGHWPGGRRCDSRGQYSSEQLDRLLKQLTIVKEPTLKSIIPKLSEFSFQMRSQLSKKNGDEYFSALLFCDFYNEFSSLDGLPIVEELAKPACLEFDPLSYSIAHRIHLKPIDKLRQVLNDNQDKFMGAYLFGSYATHDFILGWSDVDILIILSPACFINPVALIETKELLTSIQRYLFHIDPLQIHGFFVITWADLKWYPQFYFPFELFQYSSSLLNGDNVIAFRIREDAAERKKLFEGQAKYFTDLHVSGMMPETHFERKLFLHKVFTFPIFFLQAAGIHCYKKYSFNSARDLFPEFNWSCIDKPTRWMRTRTSQTTLEILIRYLSLMDPFLGAFILQSRVYRMLHSFRKPFLGVKPEELRDLIAELDQLAESCTSRLF